MEIYDDILFFPRGVCVKNVAFKWSNLMTEELKVFFDWLGNTTLCFDWMTYI